MAATIGFMPNKPKTPLRAFRIDDELWLEAVRIASARGESVSEILRDALKRYVKKHGTQLANVAKGES